MDTRTEMVFANVSATVSAGDGIGYETVQAQPPPLQTGMQTVMGLGTGVSAPQMPWSEVLRRCFTHITSPSATIVSGNSAGAIALTVTGLPSGINGMLQGVPFSLSYAGTLSAQPPTTASTTSTQIRKVLVTLAMTSLPVASSFAIGGATLTFVVGSAMTTSAGACTSAAQAASYFDFVPLPLPSANEVPVGWLNIPNNFAASAGVVNSYMICDLRAVQGYNLSAMLAGRLQP